MNKSDTELFLEENAYHKELPLDITFSIKDVLEICDRLRHKISVLNRRLQRTRTENKCLRLENQRLQSELDDAMYSIFPN